MSVYPPELFAGIVAIGLLILAEAFAIGVWMFRAGRGDRFTGILFTLGAGFFLVVALALVLGGAPLLAVLAALFFAWLAHLADLHRRLRGTGSR